MRQLPAVQPLVASLVTFVIDRIDIMQLHEASQPRCKQ